MKNPFSKLLSPLTNQPWWCDAKAQFQAVASDGANRQSVVLYNADADGFAASYFVSKLLRVTHGFEVATRAVWNYEYDFEWVPMFMASQNLNSAICLDIPIIQEPKILISLSDLHRFLIYDHHVVPTHVIANDSVIYLNSRRFGSETEDHPASAFAAGLVADLADVSSAELLVLAIGLKGDWALERYPDFLAVLQAKYPELEASAPGWKTPLGVLTSQINALFRARPGTTPERAEQVLSRLLDKTPPHEAFRQFSERYQLIAASELITKDVEEALLRVRTDLSGFLIGGILCAVLGMRTFSVGIVATILAQEKVAPIVCVGFLAGNRIQFELRTFLDSKVDLTQVLAIQKKAFRPLTSGGHPMAAGALVYREDAKRFADTLRAAFDQQMQR